MSRRDALWTAVAVAAAALGVAAGCGGRGTDTGPAWPKSAGYVPADSWKEDGGQSLAPQVPPEVAAIEASSDGSSSSDEDVVVVVADDPDEDTATEPATEPAIDDSYVSDEIIIIEIDAP